MNNQYVIVGPVFREQTYWNVDAQRWKEGLDQASTFPKGVFGEILPRGAVGIMEFTEDMAYIGFYKIPPIGVESHNFEKTT